jgi:outer membrane immunogenic protein
VRDHVVRAGVNYKFGDPIYVAGAPAAFAKAPPAAMLAGWSGAYFGGNLGWSVARNKTGAPNTFPSGEVGANEQVNLSPTAVVIGGQFGYNWQPAPNWVWGLEADLQQSARDKDKTTCIDFCSVAIAETLTQRISWLGTVRARAGWTNGPSLFYATGGLAYGRIVTDVGFFREPCPLCGPGGINPTLASGTITEDKAGWTVGAGIETRLAGAWTGKVEYLYVDLGTVSGGVVGVAGLQAGVTYGFVSHVRDHVVRAGVNYQLGAGPVVASY